jgi:hypothetical protein
MGATMKRFLCVVGLAAAVSLTWGGSAFATDQDTFNKLIAKLAPTESSLVANFKPKLACTCVSGPVSSVIHKPGVVVLANSTDLDCGVPIFNPDGSLAGFVFCVGDFVVVH